MRYTFDSNKFSNHEKANKTGGGSNVCDLGHGRALVNDITPRLPIPDLPYSTVSSIVRILEKKGFVDHKSYGRTHEYFPLISKEEYRNSQMKSFVKRYFDSSYQNVVSYFVNEKKLSAEDLKSLIEIIEKKQDNE